MGVGELVYPRTGEQLVYPLALQTHREQLVYPLALESN